MSDIEKFETILNEIPTLKAPGVSGSRIKALNSIAVKNVEHESTLITKLYTICKSVPSTHKIGTLYVVDLIVRSYAEEAKKQGQSMGPESPEGTFGSGVYKISELIESVLDDALELTIDKATINKMLKLIDVWERSQTFDPELLKRLRLKYYKTTTPPGTPPPRVAELISVDKLESKPTASNQASVLLALDSLQKLSKSTTSIPADISGSVNNTNDILSKLSSLSGNISSNAPPKVDSPPVNNTAPSQNAQSVFDMLQNLQSQGNSQNNSQAQQGQIYKEQWSNNYDNTYSRRDRSRSPRRNMPNNLRQRSPQRKPSSLPSIPSSLPRIPRTNKPNSPIPSQVEGRPVPSQIPFQSNFSQPPISNLSPNQGYMGQPGQVAPSVTQQDTREMNIEGTPHYRSRNVGFDQGIPPGTIKVFSRTLFVGGISRDMDENYLTQVLAPYATVQTATMNNERKHAFVKVYSRQEAENVISNINQEHGLRIRWGVGFGPRDCCDYQSGISTIPLTRLTEADKLWIETAQWGGSGGQPIVSGLVIDEPDIDIGSGISSKAMSKKMPTNSLNGPRSNMAGQTQNSYPQPPNLGGNYNQGLDALQGLLNQNANSNQLPIYRNFQQNY